MKEENATSVEAVLAKPQNQPPVQTGTVPVSVPAPQMQVAPNATPQQPAGANDDLLDEARRTVNRLMRGVRAGTLDGASPQAPSAPEMSIADMMTQRLATPKPTSPQPAAPGVSPVVMLTPSNGGRAMPSYNYNGMNVLLGDDIDVNDMAAVQKRMAETNDLIDMMNGAYEMED